MKVIDKMIFVFFALSLFTQSLTIDPQPVKAVAVSREAEWNISRIHAEDAYEDSKKLPRIRVALLDSGLDTDRDIPFWERRNSIPSIRTAQGMAPASPGSSAPGKVRTGSAGSPPMWTCMRLGSWMGVTRRPLTASWRPSTGPYRKR